MGVDLAHLVQWLAEHASPENGSGRLRLPTERELVTSLDISRGTLREHLSTLELMGFLDRTQGRGSYLQVPDASFIRTYFDLAGQLGHLSTADLGTAREMLELAIVEAAAGAAGHDDVARLRDLVDEMVAGSAAGDEDRAQEADLEFHRHLYRIVDNPVFAIVNDGLSHVLRSRIAERRRRAVDRAPLAAGETRVTDTVHYDIVDALAARDGDRARTAMRRHFAVWDALTGSTLTGSPPPPGPDPADAR